MPEQAILFDSNNSINSLLRYRDLESVTLDNGGGRRYQTPSGLTYPSVTTILAPKNKAAMEEWRSRVGEKEAARISERACKKGTIVHNLVEDYIHEGDTILYKDNPGNIAYTHAKVLSYALSSGCDKVIGTEIALYSDKFKIAGRVDCIGKWEGKNAIIDFKTSLKPKKKEWIEGYFMQETAYAIMLFERTGICTESIVTLIVNEKYPSRCQVFKESPKNWVKPLMKYINSYHKSL